MKNSTRRVLAAFLALRYVAFTVLTLLALAYSSIVRADEAYPSRKPISLIVPYPAGGASDYSARIFSDVIGKAIGQTVIVENIGGATGVIAANRLLKLPDDGYQIFHGSPNELILPPLVNKSVKFKSEDFELVQPITTATLVVLARRGLDVDNLDDVVRLAQQKGRAPVTYATVGIGSLYHMIGERLRKELDLNLQHVPYQGGGPALTDVAGGQVDLAILPFTVSMVHQQAQGRFKIVSALSNEVPDALKSIPLIKESKLVKNVDYRISGGYFVKTGTPAHEKNALRKAIGTALQDPEVRQKLQHEGRLVAQPMSAQESDAYWTTEISKLRELVKLIDYRPQ
ncbi:MAG: Bug family tripartite tricarboxylate transporter substrate binding protein [Advenella sp.]|uniref:Bug family tripartite tricarboxylate transporter substrate binding protein n=1 Tax=Advenella sp. TaxID=1872388 RepID=UPI003F953277